jgi:hypothetical protein
VYAGRRKLNWRFLVNIGIGYMRVKATFPTPVVLIIRNHDKKYATVSPTSEQYVIEDAREERYFHQSCLLIPLVPRRFVYYGQAGFAFARDDVYIGTPREILREVRKRLDTASPETRITLWEFLESQKRPKEQFLNPSL